MKTQDMSLAVNRDWIFFFNVDGKNLVAKLSVGHNLICVCE